MHLRCSQLHWSNELVSSLVSHVFKLFSFRMTTQNRVGVSCSSTKPCSMKAHSETMYLFPSHSKGFDDSSFVALGFSRLNVGSFISNILSSTKPNLQFHLVLIVEICLERDNRHAVSFRLLQKLAGLLLVQQQPSFSRFFVLKIGSTHGVLSNVHVVEQAGPSILGRSDVAIANVHFAVSNGLDFGPHQRYSYFQRL